MAKMEAYVKALEQQIHDTKQISIFSKIGDRSSTITSVSVSNLKTGSRDASKTKAI